MMKLKIGDILIGIDFTFLAVVAMFLTIDTTGFAILSLIACIIHEMGHLTAMFILGRKPCSIMLRGGGIKISSSTVNMNNQSILVIIAGCIVNFLVFIALYSSLPKTDIYPVMFAVLNLVTGLFNLLPIGCLDGKMLLENIGVPQRVLSKIEIVTAVAVVIFVITMFFKGGINLTIVAVMIYVIIVDAF